MANVNRWVAENPYTTLFNVKSAVTVEFGDLMFYDNADSIRSNGTSTADYTAYPIEHLRNAGVSLELNKMELKSHFIGVSMDDKDGIAGGVDMNMPIATAGKFNFDLRPAGTVYVGKYFGASGTTSGSDMYNQKIAKTEYSMKALGYFAERKVHASNADVFIISSFGPLGKTVET